MSRPIGPGEAARRLGVSTRTVQRWLREGRLPGVRVGDRLKVDPSGLALPGGRPWAGVVAAGRPIRRLLVANRGELVPRIARTCRQLGITCLTLVADDQARAWWARQADEVVPLAGTYLDIAAVLRAARQAGADAVHPGYGFLAENAEFAEAVLAAGMTWVGPPPAAMRALGDKAAARRLAMRLGIAVVAGYDGADQRLETLRREATRIGYPLLLKPSAGGGGKGMHVVRVPGELEETIARARREASVAFADERLVLERSVASPRHVEIQLLLDGRGGGVHLGERDCSLQRRYQKVIEEAPSPAVDARLRASLGAAAIALAREAGYAGAGTAEFLLDDAGDAYFLELNARLQVEHPVTEAITGRDLVADQLRIAAGEALGLEQNDVTWQGHAVEARLYAEDPWAGSVPATGTVEEARWPRGEGIRVDVGIGTGDVIGTRYDPMLAKIVCTGATRAEALARLDEALERTCVLGVTTNRAFLRRLLASPQMQAGDARTDTVERTWTVDEPAVGALGVAFAAAAAALGARRPGGPGSPPTGFRLNAEPTVRVAIGDDERSIAVRPSALDSLPHLFIADRDGTLGATVVLDVDGRAFRARLAAAPTVEAAATHAQREHAAGAAVTAPMPGSVLAVRVGEGDEVAAGEVLIILEAMKMENAVTAPASGVVGRIRVAVGHQVQRGDPLLELG